jgi:hypothetical protein
MKSPFKRGDAVARITDQIEKFTSGLQRLERRHEAAAEILEQGRDKRRDFIRDNPGVDVPAEIRRAISKAEEDEKLTTEEIAEYQAQLVELRNTLAFETERSRRDGIASDLEADAKAIDAAAADLKAALDAVAKAVNAIQRAIPADTPIIDFDFHDRPKYRNQRGPATPSEMTAMIVAEGLAAVSPQLFDVKFGYEAFLPRFFELDATVPTWRSELSPEPGVDAATATKMVITDRLRALARETRAGQRPDLDRNILDLQQAAAE